MAIGEGGAENPYVHSNIKYWSGGGYGISPSMASIQDIDGSINSLIKVSSELKGLAEQFLSGASVDILNYEIDTNPTTYFQIARKLIQKQAAVNALLDATPTISTANSKKIISQLPKKLKEKIKSDLPFEEDKEIGTRTLANVIAKSMGNAEGILDRSGLHLRMNQLIKGGVEGLDQEIQEEVEKAITKANLSKYRSVKGEIVNLIQSVIETMYVDTSNPLSSAKSFMAWFRKAFLSETDKLHFFDVKQEPEDYLNEVEALLENRIKGVITDTQNAVGFLGDEIYVSIMQADHRTIEFGIDNIESVGTVMEKDFVKKLEKEFPGLETMITHHDLAKSSQTDIVIRNKNGMTVRVQAKNSLFNKTYTFENNEFKIFEAHVQRSMNVINLIQNLGLPNVEQISYTIANALWFSFHDSVSGVRTSGQLSYSGGNGKADSSILTSLTTELSVLMDTKATNFLGITLREASDKMAEVIGPASNIFYLRGGQFIPTYTLVDQVIEDLENYKKGATAFNGLYFKLDSPKSASWAYSSEKEFWLAKASDDSFSNRVPIATAQGAAAISSLKIHGNFKGLKNYTSLTVSTG